MLKKNIPKNHAPWKKFITKHKNLFYIFSFIILFSFYLSSPCFIKNEGKRSQNWWHVLKYFWIILEYWRFPVSIFYNYFLFLYSRITSMNFAFSTTQRTSSMNFMNFREKDWQMFQRSRHIETSWFSMHTSLKELGPLEKGVKYVQSEQ